LSEMWGSPDSIFGSYGKKYKNGGVNGDSGSPVMTLVDGEAILLTTFHNSLGGPKYYEYLDEIQTQINIWGSEEVIETANLSEFIEY